MTGLTRFAFLTVAITYGLLIIGGLVHATDSGLACGQAWPSCDGTWFPAMVGGVQFEHTHRLVAGTVGILTLILAIWLWRTQKKNPLLRWSGVLATGLVTFQALLGRKTVLEGLTAWVSATHLATAMAFFALLIWISFRTQQRPPSYGVLQKKIGLLRWLVGLTAMAVYIQIVLGAVVRHLDAGLACTYFPLCNGIFWGNSLTFQLHMAHRFGAVIATLLILAMAMIMPWHIKEHSLGRFLTWSAVFLVCIQIVLGILSVLTALEPWVVTLHMGIGSLLWANLVSLWTVLPDTPTLSIERKAVGLHSSEVHA